MEGYCLLVVESTRRAEVETRPKKCRVKVGRKIFTDFDGRVLTESDRILLTNKQNTKATLLIEYEDCQQHY